MTQFEPLFKILLTSLDVDLISGLFHTMSTSLEQQKLSQVYIAVHGSSCASFFWCLGEEVGGHIQIKFEGKVKGHFEFNNAEEI